MLDLLTKIRPIPALAASAFGTVLIVASIFLTGATEVRGTSDPTELACRFVALGTGEPTEESYHETPELAAVSYAAALSAEGRVPTDAVLLDVTRYQRTFEGLPRSERTYAVRADGKTVALLALDSWNGRWAVGSDAVC